MHLCHLCVRLQLQNDVAAVFKEKWHTKSSLTIKADFAIGVPALTRERPYTKTVGDKVTTSRIGKKGCCECKYQLKKGQM